MPTKKPSAKQAKNRKKSAKQIVKIPKQVAEDAKLRKKPIYKSFRLHRSIKHTAPALPSSFRLAGMSIRLMKASWKQLAVFCIVYVLLTLLFVRGFSSPIDVGNIDDTFSEFLNEDIAGLASGFTTFGLLINSSIQGVSDIGQLYQTMLLVITSLAVIWLFRQQQAGNDVTIKMAFYRGMYPLVPFILVFSVIGLQLLPATIGNFLFTTVVQQGLIVGSLEQTVWILFLLLTVLLSLYMVASSIIALYIVTLPEMTPMRALRQARELVRHRRFMVMRKILMLAIIFLLVLGIVILPLIFFAPTLAEWLFLLITILAVPFAHGYMFSMYRELL